MDYNEADHTAEEYHEMSAELKGKSKLAHKLVAHSDVQAKLKELATYRDSVSKALQDKLKEETKLSAKRSKLESVATPKGLPPVVLGALEHVTKTAKQELQRNLRWILKSDLFDAKSPQVVQMGADRATPMSEQVSKVDYYDHQKIWVCEAMKKDKRVCASAAIAKPAVVSKIRQITKQYVPMLQSPIPMQTTLQEVFTPTFYQIAEKGWSLHLTSHLGLRDCRLHIEGEETVFGIPFEGLEGETFGQKELSLRDMAFPQFLSLVDAQGFSYHAVEPCLHVLPGRFAIVVVGSATSKTHGMQWFVPGGVATMQATSVFLKKLVQEQSELASVGSMHNHLIDYLLAEMA